MTYYTGADLARGSRTVRKNTVQIATEIPEERYGHRGTPDTRSVAETLGHIVTLSTWPYQAHAVDRKTFLSREDFGGYIQAANAYAATLTTKASLIEALETKGEQFAAWLETLDEATLGEMVGFPPPLEPSQKSRFEMLIGLKEHEMHHRAQLMLIQRQLGIVPHLTRARGGR